MAGLGSPAKGPSTPPRETETETEKEKEKEKEKGPCAPEPPAPGPRCHPPRGEARLQLSRLLPSPPAPPCARTLPALPLSRSASASVGPGPARAALLCSPHHLAECLVRYDMPPRKRKVPVVVIGSSSSDEQQPAPKRGKRQVGGYVQ